jgi:hypothetical protein
MKSGQVAFYATVATVIPVLLLGHVAGAKALAEKGVQGWLNGSLAVAWSLGSTLLDPSS